ncbi:MAG: hypothetical protein K9G70_11455, partial [Prolixibacteraceae bacterium]|nr:hypothetical protein [Prolixibacteraceae bacterium]
KTILPRIQQLKFVFGVIGYSLLIFQTLIQDKNLNKRKKATSEYSYELPQLLSGVWSCEPAPRL